MTNTSAVKPLHHRAVNVCRKLWLLGEKKKFEAADRAAQIFAFPGAGAVIRLELYVFEHYTSSLSVECSKTLTCVMRLSRNQAV